MDCGDLPLILVGFILSVTSQNIVAEISKAKMVHSMYRDVP